MDWQSPASHPLHMAQALSELIKRHFFTSPDAREKRRRKEGEKKRARRGHTALSLLWSFGEWGHFTIPSPFSFFISSTAKKKKKGKKKRKTALPIAFGQIVLAISKTIILRWRMCLQNYNHSRGRKRSSQIWLASRQPRPPRSGNEKCNFSLPAVRLNP